MCIDKWMETYNSPTVGNMIEEQEEGRVRFIFCQLNKVSTKVIRQQKMRGMEYLAKNTMLA